VGYPIYSVPFERSIGFLLRWVRFLRSHPVDVIHLHAEQAFVWLGILALRTTRSAIVRTYHAAYPFEGMLRVRRMIQRRCLRRRRIGHVSISRGIQLHELQHFRNATHVIPNWCDLTRLPRVTAEARSRARQQLRLGSEFVIAVIGNCEPVKNHDALFRAIAGPPMMEHVRVLHAGDAGAGSEVASVRELGMSKQVRFLGVIEDIATVLHASDAYCMPSLREGLSIAAIEALSVGVPAVLANVNGLSELGRHSDAVVFCEPTARGIRVALEDVRHHGGALRERSLAAAEGVREYFSADVRVAEYAGYYRSLYGGTLKGSRG
jgi:glycosyltransferase involved in cell wall biosynthesis